MYTCNKNLGLVISTNIGGIDHKFSLKKDVLNWKVRREQKLKYTAEKISISLFKRESRNERSSRAANEI